jgi:hypothetical protein
MIAIAQEEVEGEIVVSVESEFEEAKGKRTQKEEYVGPRESFSKGLRPYWVAHLGVSRVIAPFAERLRVGETTSAIWAPRH